MKAQEQSTARGDRIVYQQGAQTIYLEPLQNTFATRYHDEADRTVDQALQGLGQVEVNAAQHLIIVTLADGPRAAAALQQLRQWLEAGMVEFVTPVLREMDSQLVQILTDEITVRFKSRPSASRLHTIEQQFAVSVARQNEFVPAQYIVKVRRPFGLRTLEVASELDTVEEVSFATPNFISQYQC